MPSKFRGEKIESALIRIAAEFIRREASPASLITVTGVHFEERANSATFSVSVLPDAEAERALAFLNRKRSELQEHMKTHIRIRSIPFLTFVLDKGEKNRQRIDEIAEESGVNESAATDAAEEATPADGE